ncbi:hypothetical protein FA13DRAFT_1088709 [Coprinellus micaceus]|uniref:Uncharacterized protein n=1 Tax=Coprinellus micaceus TaxID=71717 RepID=A0A4Y7TRP5_COPMI|nr:hypothetical protein FA13DRAFT_1088709 [Coprinellus micaceus]
MALNGIAQAPIVYKTTVSAYTPPSKLGTLPLALTLQNLCARSNMKSISVLTLLAFLALRVAAAPTDPPPAEGEVPVLRCANANRDVCPSGYTCCGPLHPQEGGICRILDADQACIFS